MKLAMYLKEFFNAVWDLVKRQFEENRDEGGGDDFLPGPQDFL